MMTTSLWIRLPGPKVTICSRSVAISPKLEGTDARILTQIQVSASMGSQTGSYGYGYADFYSGAAYSVYQNSPISSWQYKYTPFLYFEDDWRVTHRLTLNLGVRWEPYVP